MPVAFNPVSMKRRHFLQFATALGLSQFDIQQQGLRYARVLAQGTPRKLALLIGINDYPESSQFSALQGCVTDIELQRQLLIHRFGFKPQDILTLTDARATRQGILAAFEEHLIKQAKPGDVVVFHFSGHGSQVIDPDKDAADGLNSTLVPVDSVLPPGFPDQGGTVKDIMGHTLFLLMSAVQTENLTVVLDSCHSGGGTRGNLRVRSRAGGGILQADPAELEYQKQWLAKLNLSPEAFLRQRRAGIARGVAIASAKRDQLAADAPFSDFYAGAFTYMMTQYLWQQTGTTLVKNAIPIVAQTTTKASSSSQEPIFEVKPGSDNGSQSLYFTPKQSVPAEAVITRVEGDRAELWLGGLDPQSLAAFERNAILVAADAQGDSQGQVKLESRTGLVARGKLLSAIKPGTPLQEKVRGIPTNLTLKIGLDPSLGQDMNAARQGLQAIKRIEARPLQQGEVQYIVGRITETYQKMLRQAGATSIPALGSTGLFAPGLDLVPESFGPPTETIAAAIERLQSKLKSLLAARIVKLTLNSNASRLNVAVSMTPAGSNQLLASTFTARGLGKAAKPSNPTPAIDARRLPLGTSIQLRVTNNDPRTLYFSVLVINSSGEMAVIFPNQWMASEEVMQVASGQTLELPKAGRDNFQLVTQEPKGTTEVLIIASSAPLRNALRALQNVASRGGQSRGPVGLSDPNDVISNLLEDMNTTSRSATTGTTGDRTIDTSQLATLSLTFEVV